MFEMIWFKHLFVFSLKSSIAKDSKTKPKNSSSSTSSMTELNKKTKMAANQKPTSNEDNEEILSIPDSFDNELFTQNSRSGDNTELVSVILEGLESNCDSLNTTVSHLILWFLRQYFEGLSSF